MSHNAWANTLTIAGCLLELAGITLAFLEIRKRGQQLDTFRSSLRDVTVYAEPVRGRADFHAAAVVISNEPPTTEQRLTRLEERLDDDLPAQLDMVREKAVQAAEEVMRDALNAARASLTNDIERVRDLLTTSLSGNRRAITSIGLLVAGLVAQGAGSVVGNL